MLPAPIHLGATVAVSAVGPVLEQLKGMFDAVVVDTSGSFDDQVLAAFDRSDVIALLATLDIPALKNLKLTLETLELLNYPRDRWRVVVNRADPRSACRSTRSRRPSASAPPSPDPVVARRPGRDQPRRADRRSSSRAPGQHGDRRARRPAVARCRAAGPHPDPRPHAPRPARAPRRRPEMALSTGSPRPTRRASGRPPRPTGTLRAPARARARPPRAPRPVRRPQAARPRRARQRARVRSCTTRPDPGRARAEGPAALQEVPAPDQPLSVADRARIAQEIADDILGYGPLEPYLRDPDITEVMVNGPDDDLRRARRPPAAGRRGRSTTRRTCAARSTRSSAGSAGGSTSPARWSTPGCPTAAASTRSSRRWRSTAPAHDPEVRRRPLHRGGPGRPSAR